MTRLPDAYSRSPRRSTSASRWCWRSLSRPWRAGRAAQRSECSSGHGRRFLANLWQMALRAREKDALCLVELRGFEPLTPCMPLTSQPLTTQRAPTRRLPSALISTEMASKRRGANCGDARLGCWRTAGRIAQHIVHGTVRAAPPAYCRPQNEFGSSVERTGKLHPL